MHIMEKPNEDMAFMQKIENKQLGQSSSKVVFLIISVRLWNIKDGGS